MKASTVRSSQRAQFAIPQRLHPENGLVNHPTPLGALTEREREVADLVADGLSNRAIAASLVAGARTVEHHLTAILCKRQIGGRTQLAVLVTVSR